MAWFFVDEVISNTVEITGEDAKHISKSLRMAVGESLTLCSADGRRHDCKISENAGHVFW